MLTRIFTSSATRFGATPALAAIGLATSPVPARAQSTVVPPAVVDTTTDSSTAKPDVQIYTTLGKPAPTTAAPQIRIVTSVPVVQPLPGTPTIRTSAVRAAPPTAPAASRLTISGRATATFGAAAPRRITVAAPRWQRDPRFAELVMDARTGEVIYGQNADVTRQIASMTKVMTAYLVFEALRDGRLTRDRSMTVSRAGATLLRTSSLRGLRQGETISVDDCLKALTSLSANDCAVTLAEAVDGTETSFTNRMTAKARSFGANNTIFKSASGLTPQDSSAHDIAIIFAALRRDFPQEFAEYFTPATVRLSNGRDHWNCKLCKIADIDAIGQKTGTTSGSGHSIITMIDDGLRSLVVVAMGTPDNPSRLGRATLLAKEALGMGR